MTEEISEDVIKAVIEKLEKAVDSEGQFKDTKINEAIVHLTLEIKDQTYADGFRELLENAEKQEIDWQ